MLLLFQSTFFFSLFYPVSHRAVNNGVLDDSVFITYIRPDKTESSTGDKEKFASKTTNWTDGRSTNFPHGSMETKQLARDGERHPMIQADDPRRYTDGGLQLVERAATITERGLESFKAQPFLPRDSIEVGAI